MANLDKVKFGDWIKVTVTRTPTKPAAIDTLQRLMRMNPRVQGALTRANRSRRNTVEHRPRAGRTWAVRPTVSKIVRPIAGQEFFLRNRPQIHPDLDSVARWVKVENKSATPPRA